MFESVYVGTAAMVLCVLVAKFLQIDLNNAWNLPECALNWRAEAYNFAVPNVSILRHAAIVIAYTSSTDASLLFFVVNEHIDLKFELILRKLLWTMNSYSMTDLLHMKFSCAGNMILRLHLLGYVTHSCSFCGMVSSSSLILTLINFLPEDSEISSP
ncbi:hypothetical protein L2E82_12030 [Cichorium intybus]|uniref:Uncharacterized protein n=1 Tax=Cichorium intybus TaxID=13427 RepID=A0ACB9GEY3_CICIN|nr:hypothetical protein L2E82_12030 [Cichorium intybus]